MIRTRSTRSRRGAIVIAAALTCTFLVGCTRSANPSYQGYAEGENVYLAASLSGHLTRLAVARGDSVQAGASAFALESVEEDAAERTARAQLSTALAQLDDLKTGKRPPELGVVQAQLREAQAQAAQSASKLARDEAQYLSATISREQLEASRATAAVDTARVHEMSEQLVVAKLPGRDQQLRALAAQADAARATLAGAQWRLAQKTVMIPSAGVVLDTMYREGEWVAAGNPVVSLLPPQNIKVRFFVPEGELGRVSLQQRVVLHCDGCAAPIEARITFISPQAEFTPPVIYSNETRNKLVFMIEAHPAPADAVRLHPGQPIEVALS
jgi:HlyD family secretion protein